MPYFEVAEAKPFHCGRMLRILRTEHHNTVMQMGLNPHRQLRECFDGSFFRRAWMIDGRLAAIGGVSASFLESAGMVWLAVSQEATRYPIAMAKTVRSQLREIFISKQELTTLVFPEDQASVRFAHFIGFRPIPGMDLVSVGKKTAIPMILRKVSRVYYNPETADLVPLH